MSPLHIFLAVFVTAVWGFNFIFIQWGLFELSPTLLCAARFLFSSFPLIFFVKRPTIPWSLIALYGLFTFALQFTLLFWGMKEGVTPGIAALLAQTQIFFSIAFAAIFLNESLTRWQLLGAMLAFLGVIVVFLNLAGACSFFGIALILASSAAWGAGNLMIKKMAAVNVFSLIAWASFFALPLLMLVCYVVDGPQQIVHSVHHLSSFGLLSVFYIAYVSTWMGYGGWNWLLLRNPVAMIAPFTLLVPVFGMFASVVFLNEPLHGWKICAGILVVGGLSINLFGARFVRFIYSGKHQKN